jgi:uncharacterized protein (TIGR02647 family)
MKFTQDHYDELNMLLRFKLTTTLEGLKVHKTAAPETIAATQRLYQKGMTTLEDGGYLTSLGHEAAEHAHALLDLIS